MENCRDVTVREAAEMLAGQDKIVIVCHQKPDGDTLGSGFAMFYSLRAMGKTVRIECSDGFPDRYHFLYPDDINLNAQPNFTPDFVLAVDIADCQLFGEGTSRYLDRVDLCIDHHPSNSRYAQNLLLDAKAAGTVELIYAVLNEMGVAISRKAATCIYTGLATDTGCFRYSNVTSNTHLLAAKMIELGVDHYYVNKLMFETKTVARMELERMVMDTLEYYYNNRFAIIVISDEATQKTGVPEEEMEGIAAIPRQIEGVEVAATLKQKGGDIYRISLRSGERIDSSKVCALLGGGGHARAAGCTLTGSLAQVKQTLIDTLRPAFEGR